MMKYSVLNYIDKTIQLYPGDTYSKYGTIVNLDDLGWTIKIIQSNSSSYKVGKEYFISHSSDFVFEFIN